jgi:hypothetical protein
MGATSSAARTEARRLRDGRHREERSGMAIQEPCAPSDSWIAASAFGLLAMTLTSSVQRLIKIRPKSIVPLNQRELILSAP